jgi:hypothetical protein
MILAGICHDGRTQFKIVQEILNAVKYRDEILDPILLPFLQQGNFNHKKVCGILFHSCTSASRSSSGVFGGI